MNIRSPQRSHREQGNALLIAVVLLLLASVITLLSLNVGLIEQRTSGNDARAKVLTDLAEAGIAQAAEYFRMNPNQLQPSGNWVKCDADDTKFPCGAIADVSVDCDDDGDGDPATNVCTEKRRGTMYYWSNGDIAVDINNDGVDGDYFDDRMLPLNNVVPSADEGRIEAVGGYDSVAYGVGVVLCRIAIPKSDTSQTRCATDPSEQSTTYVYNFVSLAGLPGENARTTVSQMLGQYAIFNAAPNKPPVVASGSVDLTGTMQIVANPDAGGPGVPVSVWTRKDMASNGTPDTCYFDEFIRFGAQKAKPPVFEDNIMVTCDTCSCSGHALSQGSGNALDEDMDILDIEPTGGHLGVNEDVRPEEFPCDMFQFMFGTQARIDDDDGNGVHFVNPTETPTESGDYFCETKLPQVSYVTPGNTTASAPYGVTVMLDRDEKYLYDNADTIFPRDDNAKKLMKESQFPTMAYPAKGFKNIIWCQDDPNETGECDVGSKTQLGTPENPVLLVVDGSMHIQGRIFGLILLRATDTKLDPATGGNATLDMNAGAAVYGSILIQGKVDKANGTAVVVYSSEIFRRLGANLPPKNSSLPGGWTDSLSY